MNTTAPSATNVTDDHRETAKYFRDAIDIGVLWSLGGIHLTAVPGRDNLGGLHFYAHILPLDPDGNRAEAAIRMAVTISLTAADAIDIDVLHHDTGTVHATARGIYIDQLNPWLLALDYDGTTPLNPRYI